MLTNNHRQLLNRALFNCESYENSFKSAKKADFIFLDPPYDTTFSDYGNQKYFCSFTL
ncbi:DNA adenine methylase [Liquorilactobacillus nagelii]|uniref:DNA adenine methylase n=1 Tax=Liquorilactobacillus nagelii TaxID=82688 RepID=UPI0039EB1001